MQLGDSVRQGLEEGMTQSERRWGSFAHRAWTKLVNIEAAGESLLDQVDSHPHPSRWGQTITVINLNFDTLLVVSVMSLLLFLWFPLSRLF